jgi:molecular chaperone HscB
MSQTGSQAGRGGGNWRGFAITGDLHTCWLCQRPVAPQALRCASCGALQPLHDLNHFALLGLNQQFDLDLADLERHYASARRTLDPERVAVKNPRAGALAERYTNLMATAFETLRNPVTRARYLLSLLDAEATAGGDSPEAPIQGAGTTVADLDALDQSIATATDSATIDRLGAVTVREIEACIHSLAAAFRAGRIGEARLALAHLDRLEPLSAAARQRRLELCPRPKAET